MIRAAKNTQTVINTNKLGSLINQDVLSANCNFKHFPGSIFSKSIKKKKIFVRHKLFGFSTMFSRYICDKFA